METSGDQRRQRPVRSKKASPIPSAWGDMGSVSGIYIQPDKLKDPALLDPEAPDGWKHRVPVVELMASMPQFVRQNRSCARNRQ